jgi:hypothetical protein
MNGLVHRSRIGPDDLARLQDRLLTDPELFRVPTSLAQKWASTSRVKSERTLSNCGLLLEPA